MNKLFENINPKEKEKLLQYLEAMTLFYKAGNSILNKERIIGIVLSGNVQIIKTDYNGNTTIIEDTTNSTIFETITLPISKDEYEIIIKEDSKIIIIEYDTILKFNENDVKIYNQFLKNLLTIMTEKIEIKNERIELLTNKTIRNKLLAYFKIYSQKSNSKVIYLQYSFTDLAIYLAVDRSAMNRELKNLKDEGLIEIKGRKIKLLYYI